MNAEHAEEYTQSLGQIVAGGWRQIALGEKLGVPKALGLSTREWVDERLGGYVKLSIEERHGAVKELTADGMSARKIAEVIGVSHATAANDVKKLTPPDPVADIATLTTDALDIQAAKDKQAKRAERDQAIAQRRAEQEQQAREQIAASESRPYTLEVADIRTWRPNGVDAVITDPPYITDDAVELHSLLGDFALDVLPDGGALAVMTWQPLLPDVMAALAAKPALVYRWTAAWFYETSARTPERTPRVFDGWKPVLVYHKGRIPDEVTYLYDVVHSPDADKNHHEWGQSPEGFRQLVRAFTEPGQTVADPFLGGGTTAVAALAEARRFAGCDISREAVTTTEKRLS